jgi:hypothetical protein
MQAKRFVAQDNVVKLSHMLQSDALIFEAHAGENFNLLSQNFRPANCFAPGETQDARIFVDDDGGCGIARGYVRSSE